MADVKKFLTDYITKYTNLLHDELDTDALKRSLDSLITQTHAETINNPSFDSNMVLERTKNAHKHIYNKVIVSFERYKNSYDSIMDERKQLIALERRLALQAMIFRVLTTFFVGLAILSVYWFGHKLGIPLPLMRLS